MAFAAPLDTSTPFALPVVPPVYSMTAGVSFPVTQEGSYT